MKVNLHSKYMTSSYIVILTLFVAGCSLHEQDCKQVFAKNNSLEPNIKTVLFSENVHILKQFYISNNLSFIEHIFGQETHHIATNASIVIVDKKFLPTNNLLNGFMIYSYEITKKDINENYLFSKEGDLVLGRFTIPEEIHHQLYQPSESSWISIIRHKDIKEAKEFFEEVGDWQEERHGEGPLHYSLSNYDRIFEIYPLRKRPCRRTEFIVQDYSSAFSNKNIIFDPDGRQICFIPSVKEVIMKL